MFRIFPGTPAPGFLEKIPGDPDYHQTIGDINPVHFVRNATNVLSPQIGSFPALTGVINVAYCDGSVRPATVTQGQTPVSNSNNIKNAFVEDPSSGGNGFVLQGVDGIIPATRFDPTQPP